MPFSDASYDPETLDQLTAAFDAACAHLRIPKEDSLTRRLVAIRIMTAANAGERDPERLRQLAVDAVGDE